MSITYVQGNVLELYPKDRMVFIPHVCNNVGAWGAGFVLGLSGKWPHLKKDYQSNPTVLGYNQVFYPEPMVCVINMIAQENTIRTNSHPLNYISLTECMKGVKYEVDTLRSKIDDYYPWEYPEIHTVKFGSGLAGGSWDKVSQLIDKIWCDINVTIYSL